MESEIVWGPAHVNEFGVTSKQAECGCDVMLAGLNFIVKPCSPGHKKLILNLIEKWNNGTNDPSVGSN